MTVVEQSGRCTVKFCTSTEFTLSRGPGRTVGPISRSILGVFAPIPADLEYWVCLHGHRQLTPEIEMALRAAEDAYLAAVPKTEQATQGSGNQGVTQDQQLVWIERVVSPSIASRATPRRLRVSAADGPSPGSSRQSTQGV